MSQRQGSRISKNRPRHHATLGEANVNSGVVPLGTINPSLIQPV